MTVSDIMTDLVVTVARGSSAEIARSVMKSARIRHLLVMENETLVGILSEGISAGLRTRACVTAPSVSG